MNNICRPYTQEEVFYLDTNSENNLDTRGVPIIGLTSEEVRERIDKGLTNHTDISTQKTVGQIVKSNLLTYFNLIFLILTVLLCIVGSFRNLTFLPVIIGNTVIGIFQELRAKKTLDKMSMLNAPHSIVVRDGEQQQIQSEELVKDDIIILSAGNQICADATVLSGSISVNEALLTGESDEIKKKSGDRLMSGSFVVSGQCYAKLDKVGNESYISQLTAQAKAMGDGEQSEMIRYINKLVKWVGIIIIPVGIILFCQAYIMNGETFKKSVVSMVAAVLGMMGEHLSQEYTRAELMRIAMSSGVDGIFVESDESDEMSQMIDEAVERGIPVVTLYGDNTHSARCSFVGVGSYNLGREYGRQVLKLASVSESTAPMTVAVLVNAHALNSAQNIVCSGIQDALEQEKIRGPEIELSLITVDDTNTFSVEESIRDIFMNEKLPDIIICLNELSTTCVYQAVVDYNCVGEVAILGYYDTDTILKAIERNVVNATISIDTEQMGAFCVDALQEYYRFGYTSQYFTADVTIIDQNNVGEYLQAQEATE